ncbi:Protein phosphatase 2C 7 [Rhizina undulata]
MSGDCEQPVRAYRYRVAAAFVAATGKFDGSRQVWGNERCVKSSWGQHKLPEMGQDAFFIKTVGGGGALAVGVADGVGGYRNEGINSADFSSTLCAMMSSEAASAEAEVVTPEGLIEVAYERILDEDDIPVGASTACVGVAKPDGTLDIANVGDSGIIILREGEVLYASPPQLHTFNTPYRLAVVPESFLQEMDRDSDESISDYPEDADLTSHSLLKGDVVLFATDGVWDNVSNEEILQVVSDEMIGSSAWVATSEGIEPRVREMEGVEERVAAAVVGRANRASFDEEVDGPFSKELHELYPMEENRGGKPDDICVICLVCLDAET